MNEELRRDCFNALHCLYIVVEKDIADDVNSKVKAYIEALESENIRLEKKALTS